MASEDLSGRADRELHVPGVGDTESCLLPFVCLFAHVANEDGDDDLQFLGRVGEHALSDFPHSRENSVGSCVTGARYVLAFV